MISSTSKNRPNDIKGTIIMTGANGSLGYWIAYSLLENYPSHHVILTVRDDSAQDENTTKLEEMASDVDNAQFSIEAVDLASLSSVRSFAESMSNKISTGSLPPISALICNAFSWSLKGQKYTLDGIESTFQVSHLSHFVLVLTLLNSMDKTSGRIVFLGSEAHDSKNKGGLNPLGAILPENLEELATPSADKPGEEMARGFQRYGNAKLANVMFMHSLNQKLKQIPHFEHVTALAVDPGNMVESRCFNNTPLILRTIMHVSSWILPVVKHFAKNFTTLEAAGRYMASISVDPEYEGARGYYEQGKYSMSSSESQDELKQKTLWTKCEKWARLDGLETPLK